MLIAYKHLYVYFITESSIVTELHRGNESNFLAAEVNPLYNKILAIVKN